MRRRLTAAIVLAIGLSPAVSSAAAGEDGRIYEYVRSNRDGTLPERIVVYRAGLTDVSVFKSVERCTNAAYVTATLDPESFEARSLVAGRLTREGTQQAFGRMDFDPATGNLSVRVEMGDQVLTDSIMVPDRPWHLYDYDLASLTVALQHMNDPTAGFSFGLPVVWVSPDEPEKFFRYLGRVDMRFVGREDRNGVPALRFEAGGPALGDKGGPVWIDASDRHIVDVEWGVPNHDGYDDFKLKLIRTGSGEAEWNAILADHWSGCER